MTPACLLPPATFMERLLLLFIACLACGFGTTANGATVLEDRFTSSSHPQRKAPATRGVWKFADGIGACTQDDATFAKNKNHGSVLWYDTAFTDGTVRFAFRAEKLREFVLTLNSEGHHAFRFVLSQSGLSVRGWSGEGHDAKPEELMPQNVKAPALADGRWTEAVLQFEGSRCTLVLGPGFKQTFEHPAIAKKKTTLGLGFSFGTLAVRDLKIETPDKPAAP